jgi:capsule polysaccharide export protein KpsE/RkpR
VISEGQAAPGGIGFGELLGRFWEQFRETWRQILGRLSFWTVIAAAVCLSTVYYFVFAESMYVSSSIITVQNKSSASSSLLGGFLGSTAGGSQVQQLYDYIESPDMLKILDQKFHLRSTYASSDRNPFWRLWFPASDDEFLHFYQNMLDVEPDTTNGLLSIDVLDYDPHRSQAIAREIVAQTQKFMNAQASLMQTQTMTYARDELGNAVKAVQVAKIPYEQTVAELRLSAAQSALATATGLANQQQVFVIPVATPSYPTDTTRPQRLLDIATITLVVAVAYAVSFLMWSNVRDHRKA